MLSPVGGSATLRDRKELNLDGTPKVPYRHPNFGNTKFNAPQAVAHVAQQQVQVEDLLKKSGLMVMAEGRDQLPMWITEEMC